MSKENNSFIPINRRIFSHGFWKEDRTYSKAEAWIDLIQSARFEVSQGRMLIGMKVVMWNRGELVASVRFLSTRWKWSIGKITRFLDLLEAEKMIKRRQCFGQTIITLLNYEVHNVKNIKKEQQTEHLNPLQLGLSDEERNTNRHKTDTVPIQERYKTNKGNKGNNENKSIAPPPTLQEVINYFIEKGYSEESAKKAFEYYEAGRQNGHWFDSRGNIVLNWKQKMNSVWFKPENLIQQQGLFKNEMVH